MVIILTFYFIFQLYLIRSDLKFYKVFFTPFNLLSIPSNIIIFFQLLLSIFFNTYHISISLLVLYTYFLLLFFLSNRLFTKNIILKRSKFISFGRKFLEFPKKYFIIMGYFFSFSLLLRFFSLTLTIDSISRIVQPEFQSAYTNGIFFYFRIMLLFVSTYYFSTVKRISLKVIFTIILFLLPNAITFVKGILLINLASLYLVFILKNQKKIIFKSSLFLLFFGIISFILVIFIENTIWGDAVLDFSFLIDLFNSFIHYFFAGIQSLIINLELGKNFVSFPNATIAIFFNPISRILGLDMIIPNNPDNFNMLYFENNQLGVSNVNTFIGTLYLYNGFVFSSFLIVSLSYFFNIFFKMYLLKKDHFSTSLYSFISSGLLFSWFEYYYLHSFWYYVIIIVFMSILFEKLILRHNNFGPVV